MVKTWNVYQQQNLTSTYVINLVVHHWYRHYTQEPIVLALY